MYFILTSPNREVRLICHWLGLGHETMVCALCLYSYAIVVIFFFIEFSAHYNFSLQCWSISWSQQFLAEIGVNIFGLPWIYNMPKSYFTQGLFCCSAPQRRQLDPFDFSGYFTLAGGIWRHVANWVPKPIYGTAGYILELTRQMVHSVAFGHHR